MKHFNLMIFRMQIIINLLVGPTDSFELRADRLGRGNGRIYTVTYTAKDNTGNVTTHTATVTVPHDQSK